MPGLAPAALAAAGAAGCASSMSDHRDARPAQRRGAAELQPPVTTRVYAGNGTLLGEYARERRIFVPIAFVPKLVKRGLHPRRGPQFLQPSRHRSVRHPARRHQGCRSGAGRHAGRRAPPPSPSRWRENFLLNTDVKFSAQDARGDPGHPHRRDLSQGEDPRALSQRDLSRREQLWRGRGGAELFRQVAGRARHRRSRLPGGAAQGAQPITIRASITTPRSTGATG